MSPATKERRELSDGTFHAAKLSLAREFVRSYKHQGEAGWRLTSPVRVVFDNLDDALTAGVNYLTAAGDSPDPEQLPTLVAGALRQLRVVEFVIGPEPDSLAHEHAADWQMIAACLHGVRELALEISAHVWGEVDRLGIGEEVVGPELKRPE